MKLTRLAVVLTMALAWLVASNHCALASIAAAAAPQEEHSCCHQEGPAPVPQTMMECCDALGAPLPIKAAAPGSQLFALFPAWTDVAVLAVPPAFALVVGGHSNNGPPGLGFTELVLNRSVLAHAPPVVVA